MKRRDFIRSSLGGLALSTVGSSCQRAVNPCELEASREFDARHYTRMFPTVAGRPTSRGDRIEEGLVLLGSAMRGGDNEGHHGTPDAGYTYFGQFIDHDLTLDLTSIEDAQPNAGCTRNFRTPCLDLDHVYGGGPSLSPFLYCNGVAERKRERFLIGRTSDGAERDLPRNSEGIALVGDPRQDENLIIAQLHVAFLKLHNRILGELERNSVPNAGPFPGTLFEQARRLVTWHYQYLILNDFLRAVLDRDAIDCGPNGSRPVNHSRTNSAIPIEFSAAAFRFGHSMVRDKYHFYNNVHPGIDLQALLLQTGSGGGAIPCLKTEWVINWYHFFSIRGTMSINEAQPINTSLAEGLHGLPVQTQKLFNAPSSKERREPPPAQVVLPVHTLLRGGRMGLPSGQTVARILGIKNPLRECEITADLNGTATSKILKEYEFHRDTPLWFYILKEAEVRQSGQLLGKVGSHIVSQVIGNAVRGDPNSYLSIDADWTPVLELNGKRITRIIDLLQYATQ